MMTWYQKKSKYSTPSENFIFIDQNQYLFIGKTFMIINLSRVLLLIPSSSTSCFMVWWVPLFGTHLTYIIPLLCHSPRLYLWFQFLYQVFFCSYHLCFYQFGKDFLSWIAWFKRMLYWFWIGKHIVFDAGYPGILGFYPNVPFVIKSS